MKILLDTNVFIYLANGTLDASIVANKDIFFASICKIEALGYSKITAIEQSYISQLFAECFQLELDEPILERAIALRLEKNMSLGDSIVAASAIDNNCVLWTANVKDFAHIDDLKTFNPLKAVKK